MNFIYRLKRWRVQISRTRLKDLELNIAQKKAYEIVIKLINEKGSNLMYDLTSSIRCIKNKEKIVIIHKNRLTIVFGENSDDVQIDDIIHDNIVRKFNNKMSRKMNAIEREVLSKIANNLDKVLHEMSESDKNKPNS